QHHEKIADHRRLPLLVQVDDVLAGKLIESHFHHPDGPLDDLLSRGDDRRGLLSTEHRLRDLLGVGEMAYSRLDDLDPRLLEPLLDLLPEVLRDLSRAATERSLTLLMGVVGIDRGEVAESRLGLHV